MSGAWQWAGQLVVTWRRRLFIVRALQGEARVWAVRRYLERKSVRAARINAATLRESGRLVFVCHGNIMRSAFATQVAREHKPTALPRIVGAGTHAVAGRMAQYAALEVSRELSPPLDGHAATPLHAVGLTADDVIVCMDALNEANVIATYPALASRVFRAGDIAGTGGTLPLVDREIQDPYGRGVPVTREAFERVAMVARAWVDRLFLS